MYPKPPLNDTQGKGVVSQDHTFIIRINPEEKDVQGRVIYRRGSIEHVGDDQRLYFQNLDSILPFIKEHCGFQIKSLPWWQTLWARIRHAA